MDALNPLLVGQD